MPSFNVKFLSLFSFGYDSSSTEFIIDPGQTILVKEWSWRRFGYKKTFYSMSKEGKLSVLKT